jgi:hypothetical protein
VRQYLLRGEAELRRAAALVLALNPEKVWRLEIKQHVARRTISQNKLYFAILTEIANETGSSVEEMHEAMKRKFLPTTVVTVGDEEIPVTARSSKLAKDAFSEYVEKVIAFAATELAIRI